MVGETKHAGRSEITPDLDFDELVIIIPDAVVQQMGLDDGDELDWYIDADGKIWVERVRN